MSETVKVKCLNKRFMGVDQYGNTYHDLKNPRKDLLAKLGAGKASLMYVDTESGGAKPVGYVIRGHWINVFEVCDWKPAR